MEIAYRTGNKLIAFSKESYGLAEANAVLMLLKKQFVRHKAIVQVYNIQREQLQDTAQELQVVLASSVAYRNKIETVLTRLRTVSLAWLAFGWLLLYERTAC
jgi:hypothetical protein